MSKNKIVDNHNYQHPFWIVLTVVVILLLSLILVFVWQQRERLTVTPVTTSLPHSSSITTVVEDGQKVLVDLSVGETKQITDTLTLTLVKVVDNRCGNGTDELIICEWQGDLQYHLTINDNQLMEEMVLSDADWRGQVVFNRWRLTVVAGDLDWVKVGVELMDVIDEIVDDDNSSDDSVLSPDELVMSDVVFDGARYGSIYSYRACPDCYGADYIVDETKLVKIPVGMAETIDNARILDTPYLDDVCQEKTYLFSPDGDYLYIAVGYNDCLGDGPLYRLSKGENKLELVMKPEHLGFDMSDSYLYPDKLKFIIDFSCEVYCDGEIYYYLPQTNQVKLITAIGSDGVKATRYYGRMADDTLLFGRVGENCVNGNVDHCDNYEVVEIYGVNINPDTQVQTKKVFLNAEQMPTHNEEMFEPTAYLGSDGEKVERFVFSVDGKVFVYDLINQRLVQQ